MFYVPEWVSLSEVVGGVLRYYQEYNITEFSDITDIDKPLEYFGTKARRLIWHKLSEWANNDQLGVLCPNGKVVLASEGLVRCLDPGYAEGLCISLIECTVGSATPMVEHIDETGIREARQTVEEKRMAYGPYLYCPVLVDFNAYGTLVGILQGDHRVKRKPMSHKEIAEHVVETYRAGGPRPTRKMVKDTYMPKDKVETFNAVWKDITSACPELSIGGRPKT